MSLNENQQENTGDSRPWSCLDASLVVCAVVNDIKKVNKHKVSFGQGKRKRGQERKGKEG